MGTEEEENNKVQWYNTMPPSDLYPNGIAVSIPGPKSEESRQEAIRQTVELLRQSQNIPETREIGAGPINDQMAPTPNILFDPDQLERVDITPRATGRSTMGNLGGPIPGSTLGGPPSQYPDVGYYPPNRPIELHDILEAAAGPDATLEEGLSTIRGDEAILPQYEDVRKIGERLSKGMIDPDGRVNLDEMSIDNLKVLAALEDQYGALPGIHPKGATGTDFKKLYEGKARAILTDSISNATGTPDELIDLQNPLDMSYIHRLALETRVGFSPTQVEMARALDEIPGYQSIIVDDPIRDGNTFLFARKGKGATWHPADLGLWQQLLVSAPQAVATMAGAYVAARIFPFLKLIPRGGGKQLFPWMGKAGAGETGASTVLGRVAGAAFETAGAIGAGAGGQLIEYKLMDELFDIPEPSAQAQINELTQIALENIGGDLVGRGVLVPAGKYLYGKVAAKFSASPQAYKDAIDVADEIGLPRPNPTQMTAMGRMRFSRLLNLTSYGNRFAVAQSRKAMLAWQGWFDDIGNVVDVAWRKQGIDPKKWKIEKVPGTIAELGEKATYRLGDNPFKQELVVYDEALDILTKADKQMNRTLFSSAGTTSSTSTKDMVGNFNIAYQKWDQSHRNVYDLYYTTLGEEYLRRGAVWDSRVLKEKMREAILGRPKIQGSDGSLGNIFGEQLPAGGDLGRLIESIDSLPRIIGNGTELQAMINLRASANAIESAGLTTNLEREVLGTIQHQLDELLHSPHHTKTRWGMEVLSPGAPGQAPAIGPGGGAERQSLKDLSAKLSKLRDSYRGYNDTKRAFLATGLLADTNTETIGRKLIDAENNPQLVLSLKKVLDSNGDAGAFDQIRAAYIDRLSSLDPDKLSKLLIRGGDSPDSRQALNVLLGGPGSPIRKALARSAQLKKTIVDNPAAIKMLTDVSSLGEQLLKFNKEGNFEYNAALALLKETYGKDGPKMALWAVLDSAMNKSLILKDGQLIVDGKALRRNMLAIQESGMVNDILGADSKKAMQFGKMISQIEFLPAIGESDVALGMAGQELAGSTLLIPDIGRPLKTFRSRLTLITMAINSRVMLDAWLGGPVGHGGVGPLGASLRYPLYQSIMAMEKVEKQSNKYKAGKYEGVSTAQQLRDFENAHVYILPAESRVPEEYDPTQNTKRLIRQAQEQERERLNLDAGASLMGRSQEDSTIPPELMNILRERTN